MYQPFHKSQRFAEWLLLSSGALVMALTLPIAASAQSNSAPKIVRSKIRYVTPVSGKLMYDAYCASCHGANGKGNATAAEALSQQPTDLTLLSSHNGGKFPSYRVRDLLLDPDTYHDRAATKMPVWAPAFRSLEPNHPGVVRLRVVNLMAYLKTIQSPPGKAGTEPESSANPR